MRSIFIKRHCCDVARCKRAVDEPMESADRWSPCSRIISASGNCHRERRCSSDAVKAASILAKVHRDHQMALLDQVHPEYGFAQHKGYPTPEHLEALSRYGLIDEHRRTFGPCKILTQ